MFIHNINPDIFYIGPFPVRFYGIVYALGFVLVTLILVHHAKKGRIKNLDQEKAQDLVIWGMIAGLIGARIFHVISDFDLYRNNILGMFMIWNGGLGFQGGLIGGIAAAYIFTKKNKIDFWSVLDKVSVPIPLIIAFGRIANFINSEHIGRITDVSWCVVFQRVDLLCRHPAQLYQAAGQFFLFLMIILISRMNEKKKWVSGTLAGSFMAGYGIIRFITDFFRSDYSLIFLGLSHTQIINILMVGAGIYIIIKRNKK